MNGLLAWQYTQIIIFHRRGFLSGPQIQHQQDRALPEPRRQLRRAGDHDANLAADDSHFPRKNRTPRHV